MKIVIEKLTLICFSHLRWNFVYQRPQHLLSRFSKVMRVLFIEEPVYDASVISFVKYDPHESLTVIEPHFPANMSRADVYLHQQAFLSNLLRLENINHYCFWFYTPMALPAASHLSPLLSVYDCMDELSAFRFAPPELRELEQRLFSFADIVFTGGHSLYEAKKHRHDNIHPFPSSIDYDHFSKARTSIDDPPDQRHIPHPRFGFYGVIDERMDLEYIRKLAEQRPQWQFIFLGPTAKINPSDLPVCNNIHFLGMKTYDELPQYLAGWDVAMMPFALNESTRYISPTKTPEFLAAGKPVISTPIRDVVSTYQDVIHIAATPEEFIAAVERGIYCTDDWLAKVDSLLASNSWDLTWRRMMNIMEETLSEKLEQPTVKQRGEYV